MRKVVLYRRCNDTATDDAEIEALQSAGFVYLKNRTQIQSGDLVVPRYSALPFYQELESDVNALGAKLINTYYQHQYIADLQNWVIDLGELTPLTWAELKDIPDDGVSFLRVRLIQLKESIRHTSSPRIELLRLRFMVDYPMMALLDSSTFTLDATFHSFLMEKIFRVCR